MDFGFSSEQEQLRAQVRKLVQSRYPLRKVREMLDAGPMAPELWRDLCALGLPGLTVPEEHGGAGLSLLDLTVALEETGAGLLPSPLLATSLACSALRSAGTDAQRAALLPELAAGTRVGTFACLEGHGRLDAAAIQLRGTRDGDGFVLQGEKSFVDDVGAADLFIVAFRTGEGPDELTLCVLDRGADVFGENQKTMDATKRMGTLTLEGARVAPQQILGSVGSAWPLIRELYDRAAVMVCAEALGSAAALHRMTVDYAKTRVQFDSVIGRYQGVKHPLAEMYVDLESARSLTYYAAWTADHRPADLSLSASRAKAYVAEAFGRLGQEAIQLHGAIGYTAEHDAQLFMKRSRWVRPAYGDADYHYERVIALGGL